MPRSPKGFMSKLNQTTTSLLQFSKNNSKVTKEMSSMKENSKAQIQKCSKISSGKRIPSCSKIPSRKIIWVFLFLINLIKMGISSKLIPNQHYIWCAIYWETYWRENVIDFGNDKTREPWKWIQQVFGRRQVGIQWTKSEKNPTK